MELLSLLTKGGYNGNTNTHVLFWKAFLSLDSLTSAALKGGCDEANCVRYFPIKL